MRENTRYVLALFAVLAVAVVFFTPQARKFLSQEPLNPGINPASVSTALPIFNGDTVPLPAPECAEYASVVQQLGVDNSTALKLVPDEWHAPVLKIYCGGRSRMDMSQYANLTFKIRSETTNADPIRLFLYTFAGVNGYVAGQPASISEYIEGGAVTNSWKQVTIPISALKAAGWDLANVDGITFSVSQNRSVFYVDDLILTPAQVTIPTTTSTTTTTTSVPTETLMLFNGDSVTIGSSCLEYASTYSGGVNGTNALKLAPDEWHAPLVKILCEGRSRMNLGGYANMVFLVKSDSASPDSLRFNFSSYATGSRVDSNVINVSNFITGGSITNEWKQVIVPIGSIKTASWDLNNVDNLYFSVSPSRSVFLIDNVIFYPAGMEVPPYPETPTEPVVDTQAPTITFLTPTGGSTVSGTVQLGVNATDNVKVGAVSYRYGGTVVGVSTIAPFGISLDTRAMPNGLQTVSATVVDTSNNSGTASLALNVQNAALDTSAPFLSIRTPIKDSTIKGTISFSAIARDNVGVTGMKFWSDNNYLGEDVAVPFEMLVNTVNLTDGPHNFIAVARDAAGNRATSSVRVIVSNSVGTTTPPIGFDLSKKQKIWDGESGADREVGLERASVINSGAYSGSYAFSYEPTKWAGGVMRLLENHPSYRKSISESDFLQMMVKLVPNSGALPTNPPVRFSVYGWPDQSASVPLENYIVGGGSLGTGYKMIRIPISALKVPGGYAAYSVESLIISYPEGYDGNYKVVVDDIYGVDLTPNDIKSVKTISNKVVRLSTSSRFNQDAVRPLTNYVLRSSTDSNFANGRSPSKVGLEWHINGFEGSVGGSYGSASAPLFESNIFLSFDTALKHGSTYTLTVNDIPDLADNHFASPKSQVFVYMDDSITGSVQANQVGYIPVSPKFAYIGNYLGDAGVMTGTPLECKVINEASGSVVKTAVPTVRKLNDPLSGNNVYSCEFSDVTAPGTYHVYVPGFGRTYSFKIDQNVFKPLTKALFDFFYMQRANQDISLGQWSRPAGTVSTDLAVVLHPSNYVSSQYNPLPISESSIPRTKKFDMIGGWYDAGDYGKYILPASGPIFDLLLAYELYPQKFYDGQSSIPERSNGIPDILDELKYEMDWMQKMQDPEDGGAFDRVTAQNWEQHPYDYRIRYLSPKSTHATALYAASLAHAGSVFKSNGAFQAKYPGYADELIRRAKEAWKFLADHPTPLPQDGTSVRGLGIGGGDYQDTAKSNCSSTQSPGVTCPYSDADNRAWAAAALYKATGDKTYEQAFKVEWAKLPPFYGTQNNFVNHNFKASYNYLLTSFATDSTIINTIKQALRGWAEEQYAFTMNNQYRVGYSQEANVYIQWGQFAHGASRSFNLVNAYTVLGDAKYLEAAKINLDVGLGANPQNRSYITGFGQVQPNNPLHLTSVWLRQNSGATAPVPGIPVFGPHYWGSFGQVHTAAAQTDGNVYPSITNNQYPILRRYFDLSAFVEQSEFGIGSIAPILAGFAYFSN